MNKMIIQCTEIDEYEQDFDMRLYYNNNLIATVKVVFRDSNLVETSCMLEEDATQAPILSGLHATSIVTHTLITAWGKNDDCVADVFSRGSLIVDPNLYTTH